MIIRQDTTTDTELHLIINNGDFQALTEAVERLNFKDAQSLLRFMLAVISKSATRSVVVTNNSGEQTPLTPAATLLKDTQNTNN